ncbi:LysR family transcriptional regulator [Streptomyces sp. NBC_01294]|uniref:LysR family transcriptional regulator n=1 Tax=Streptomyces sp. NBC_01294 TaxID=2903815 RepID=UPI002DDC37A6|nr:LysR substrate-binding domain-containing protein [Streptomyces sp. NBC_01294]WRZ55482.1 LysR substrate-binding domain-containing protein [Streptomyces sp. NBC_01294]WRZ61215.1 LysR substrate-binding domain-containing protein [Streptomyces sp. NBC_01294]
MIDVQRLRVLRAVSQHGSFNKAAAALLLTPSAVSQHIAVLERTLGHPVAVRSTRGVTLTEPGRLLVEAAEAISAELDQVRREIDRLTEERPRLTVATFTSGGRHLLPAALSRFVAAHPEVELTVREGEPEEAVPMVRGGAADLALTYHFDGPAPVRPGGRPGLDWMPLMEDPLWLVLPRGHRLAGRTSVDLAELAADRWVLGCLKTEAFLRRYADLAGLDLRVAASTTDYFFAQTLVAAGVGVSLVPQVALAEAPAPTVVRVEPPRPARHIGLVLPRRRRANPYAAALAEAVTAAASTRTGVRP